MMVNSWYSLAKLNNDSEDLLYIQQFGSNVHIPVKIWTRFLVIVDFMVMSVGRGIRRTQQAQAYRFLESFSIAAVARSYCSAEAQSARVDDLLAHGIDVAGGDHAPHQCRRGRAQQRARKLAAGADEGVGSPIGIGRTESRDADAQLGAHEHSSLMRHDEEEGQKQRHHHPCCSHVNYVALPPKVPLQSKDRQPAPRSNERNRLGR
jgi:hypothetical protein